MTDNSRLPDEPPCKKCGHPGPFIPNVIEGQTDPRVGLTVLCAACGRQLTYDTHHWQDDKSKRYLCCECMISTKPIRDLAKTGELSAKLPFKMTGRKLGVDGVRLILRHDGCDNETSLLIKNADDLMKRTQVKCDCGFERTFYCSDAKIGRKLLELLKLPDPEDRFDSASGPSQN